MEKKKEKMSQEQKDKISASKVLEEWKEDIKEKPMSNLFTFVFWVFIGLFVMWGLTKLNYGLVTCDMTLSGEVQEREGYWSVYVRFARNNLRKLKKQGFI